MNRYYQSLHDIEFSQYRDYFNTEFMPTHFKNPNGRYNLYQMAQYRSPKISELEDKVRSHFDFPNFDYFIIFKHFSDQPIHVDGVVGVRFTSLNLALTGYKDTKMKFYKITNNIMQKTDAHYYDKANVEFDEEFHTDDQWMLVNSGEPHNVVNINSIDPRVTICFRFADNPKYSELALKVQKKWATDITQ